MKIEMFPAAGLLAALLIFSAPAPAQTVTLTTTTTSAAIAAADKSLCLTSATGVNVPGVGTNGSTLFITGPAGDAESVVVRSVTSASGSCFNITRSQRPAGHASGATVYIGRGNDYYTWTTLGDTCTVGTMAVRPWIDVLKGIVSDCINGAMAPINDGPLVSSCGTAAAGSPAVCVGTTIKAVSKNVIGTAALLSATPSAVTITGMPAFAGTNTYICDLTPIGGTAAIAAGGLAFTAVSATSFTVTGPNTVTTAFSYDCKGQ